jgi:hypothetical protein
MSILRTIVFSVLSLLPAGAALAHENPLQTFASCAGRLSAVMEHQWLMSDPASDRTEDQRAAMLSLVDAIMAPDQAREVLSWRIDAKQAHAVLLTRATFNTDPTDAEWALRRAETELAACTGLLLS